MDIYKISEIISKEYNILSEIDFRNSAAFNFLISNLPQQEKSHFQDSQIYQNAIAIMNNITIDPFISNKELYISTESINLNECGKRDILVAGQTILLYLTERANKTDDPLIKKMCVSAVNSLTGKKSDIKIEEQDTKKLRDRVDLLMDDTAGKFVQ